jgi:hypothetical protein
MLMVSCHVPTPSGDEKTRPILSQSELPNTTSDFKGLRSNRDENAVVWRNVTGAGISSITRNMPVNAGDQLRIIVFRERDLSNLFFVADDGTIDYPLLGRMDVAGLTPAQIAHKIRESLRGDYLIAPHVMADRVEFCAQSVAMGDHS